MRALFGLVSGSLCAPAGSAWAQMPPPPADQPGPLTDPAPPPPPASEPTAPATTSSTAAAPAPAASSANDGTLGSAVGVGVHAMLTGPAGPAIVYNGGRFHIEGMLAFADEELASTIAIAGRAWFHVHESPGASLSVGGGLGFVSLKVDSMLPGGMDDDQTNILLEGGAQVRFFATRNVAISASLGLGIVAGDGELVSITGQLVGGVGVTYFIF